MVCFQKLMAVYSILGHKIPVLKPPVQLVEELEIAEPFMKSVLKG